MNRRKPVGNNTVTVIVETGVLFYGKAVIGVFRSENRAREAINELKAQGFNEEKFP